MLTSSTTLTPLLAFSLALPGVYSQTARSKAEIAFNVLEAWYNTNTGLWDTTGWWNSANIMTAIADLAALDLTILPSAEGVFQNTYVRAPAVNPDPLIQKTMIQGEPHTEYTAPWPSFSPLRSVVEVNDVNASAWLDGFYDDDGWWALAWIAAYDLTQNPNYLETAEGIFQGMTEAWPSNCSNGGIWWDVAHTYVNAIANELFLSVAAHLANRASNKSLYLDWALKEWAWFEASGMINSQNNINDGLTPTCVNNGETVWSYNQGVILGGLVELNKASPNPSYLTKAGQIAQAAIATLTDSNKVLHDACEPNCGPDGTQFKGVFMRNLQILNNAAPQAIYQTAIRASATSMWNNDRNSNNQLSVNWAGPFISPANASTHSSAMEALIAAVAIQ